jgi:hypothetical protein
MKKFTQIFILFFSFQAIFGQADLEQNLINTLNSYEKGKNEDSKVAIWNQVVNSFRILIQDKNAKSFAFESLSKKCETSAFKFYKLQSENQNFIAYSLIRGNFYSNLNFVCAKTKDDNYKIVYEDIKSTNWRFVDIENIYENEFLLIERYDDLSFSCNYATVFGYKKDKATRKNVFSNRKRLTVCNFTMTQSGTATGTSGETILIDEPRYSPLIEIKYDRDSKTLFYGKPVKESKYLNGKFTIEDYDERKAYE